MPKVLTGQVAPELGGIWSPQTPVLCITDSFHSPHGAGESCSHHASVGQTSQPNACVFPMSSQVLSPETSC